MLFNAQEEDDDRNGGKDRCSKQILPLDDVESVEHIDSHGNGLQDVGGNQRQGNGIFVPGIDENEDQGGDDARCSSGQQDSKK